ncbi:MAG: ABC transporter permease subunit [Chlamydiia bacterium]|nr:ABC transporter permease subunit [Chlamydiia bacterium]
MKPEQPLTHFQIVYHQFKKNPIGIGAFWVLLIFSLIGLYAPFFASSKPLLVIYDKKIYFPLFRYLFYSGFYTKRVDLFYNLLMLTLPITVTGYFLLKKWASFLLTPFIWSMLSIQIIVFVILALGVVSHPEGNKGLTAAKQEHLMEKINLREDPLLMDIHALPSWDFELRYSSDYAKLNLLLRYRMRKKQHEKLSPYAKLYHLETGKMMPTLFYVDQINTNQEIHRLNSLIEKIQKEAEQAKQTLPQKISAYLPSSMAMLMAKKELEQAKKHFDETVNLSGIPKEELRSIKTRLSIAKTTYSAIEKEGLPSRLALIKAKGIVQKWEYAKQKRDYLLKRRAWLEEEQNKISFIFLPLLRPFHWEDDAGGQQSINKYIPWWTRTRVNRKDLVSALIFGIRISLVVGVTAVLISLMIGIPVGTIAGYFAGKTDLILFRIIEVWEAMPTFFMLLLIIAIAQNKSIFLVIGILGIFGWTGFGRFIRAEVLKQRQLPYVLACKSLGYSHGHIMFSHVLPNAIPPILTLLPFSMMVAITSEAGLSFLGLGEEGSPSWGVLMDEGRSVFPGEGYLLWPPAILLTILLISIALVGDGIRDALDPKLRTF